MLFAFRSEGQLVLPPSVKRESLLSKDVILLDFSFFFRWSFFSSLSRLGLWFHYTNRIMTGLYAQRAILDFASLAAGKSPG